MALDVLDDVAMSKSADEVTLSSTHSSQEESQKVFCQIINGKLPLSTPDLTPYRSLPFLRGKELADWSDEQSVDLLLCMHDVHQCYTSEICHSADRQVEAHKSIFGWIIR